MGKFGKTEIAKIKFLCCRNPKKFEMFMLKTNPKYLIGYLDKYVRPLVLMMPKRIGYVKTFKFENKINKLLPFRIDDVKLLQKYKYICTKIEDLKNFKLKAFPVYDNR